MISFRSASINDAQLILDLVYDLAKYEHLEHEVVATKQDIIDSIFINNKAKVIIFEYYGNVAGYSIYFNNYSTFLCNAGIYIEDIYVKNEYRNIGIGKAFFAQIKKIAKEEGAKRIEWTCLSWNTTSIEFYKKLGAEHKKEWDLFRINI